MREEELVEGAAITPTLRLVRRIGGGGMGAVWLAQHLGLETRVVVKFIAHQIADNAIAAARFRREAAAAAQVRSPHCVQMLDYGLTERGTPYIVMELLEGRDLADHLRARGRLAPSEVVTIVKQLCKALSRAHDLGIIHRDIKPENIFLCDHDDDEPFVKLLDFGIAKDADDVSVTTTGAAVGTPHYMSPEQAVGAKGLDHRSDLWSLGVLTFFLLTGRRPFQGETTGALTLAIFNGPIPKPTDVNPALPAAIDEWFARACSRDPDGRPPTAKAFAGELAAALATDVPRAPRVDELPLPERAPLAPTLEYVPPSRVPASTLEFAPTTERDVVQPPSARTTSGLTGNVSTAPGAPRRRTRAPLFVGVGVAALLDVDWRTLDFNEVVYDLGVTFVMMGPPEARSRVSFRNLTPAQQGVARDVLGRFPGGPERVDCFLDTATTPVAACEERQPPPNDPPNSFGWVYLSNKAACYWGFKGRAGAPDCSAGVVGGGRVWVK